MAQDQRVVDGLGAGESRDQREAFDRALCRALRLLHGRAVMMAGNLADAEDLVQQTIERALGARQRPPSHEVQPWLLRILKNLVIDRWRGVRLVAGTNVVESLSVSAVEFHDAEPWWHAITRAEVEDAVQRAPAMYRDVFVLCTLERLSYRQAGARLGVLPGTVATRLFRARRWLRRRLEARDRPGSAGGPAC